MLRKVGEQREKTLTGGVETGVSQAHERDVAGTYFVCFVLVAVDADSTVVLHVYESAGHFLTVVEEF